jgi:hypothetical protein
MPDSPRTPLHAFGVDDVDSILRSSFPNSIPDLGHFCKAVVGYFWLAPKEELAI